MKRSGSKALRCLAAMGWEPVGGNRSVLAASAAAVEPGKVERLLAWRRFSKGHDEDRKPCGRSVTTRSEKHGRGTDREALLGAGLRLAIV